MSFRYVHHFFSLNCAQELIPFFVGCKKRAAKEVTESFGMLACAQEEFGDLKDWVIICVGDGKRPRTGATFRYVTKAHWVYSIDPATDTDWFDNELASKYRVNPRRMSPLPYKAEEMAKMVDCEGKHCLIASVHSHSDLRHDLNIPYNYASLNAISLPCCKNIPPKLLLKEFATRTNLKTYSDEHIMSPKNQLYIWKNI